MFNAKVVFDQNGGIIGITKEEAAKAKKERNVVFDEQLVFDSIEVIGVDASEASTAQVMYYRNEKKSRFAKKRLTLVRISSRVPVTFDIVTE